MGFWGLGFRVPKRFMEVHRYAGFCLKPPGYVKWTEGHCSLFWEGGGGGGGGGRGVESFMCSVCVDMFSA